MTFLTFLALPNSLKGTTSQFPEHLDGQTKHHKATLFQILVETVIRNYFKHRKNYTHHLQAHDAKQ